MSDPTTSSLPWMYLALNKADRLDPRWEILSVREPLDILPADLTSFGAYKDWPRATAWARERVGRSELNLDHADARIWAITTRRSAP
jgi:hypothetical protein